MLYAGDLTVRKAIMISHSVLARYVRQRPSVSDYPSCIPSNIAGQYWYSTPSASVARKSFYNTSHRIIATCY